jgi:hypothetical protein
MFFEKILILLSVNEVRGGGGEPERYFMIIIS